MWRYGIIAAYLAVLACAQQAAEYPIEAYVQLDTLLPSTIAEWTGAKLVLVNRSERTIHCIPRVIITKEGRLLARTKVPRTHAWNLVPGGQLLLHGAQLWEGLVFPDDPRHLDQRWLPLGDTGIVTICIHITDSLGIEHFAAPLCIERRIFHYHLPLPLSPVISDTLRWGRSARHVVHFQWMPVLPWRPATCYIVRCYPLPDTLSIAEAVRVQQPLLEQRVCNTTTLQWRRPNLPFGRYVWTVRAIDEHTELPIATSDGYSLPATFYVDAKSVSRRPVSHSQRRKR